MTRLSQIASVSGAQRTRQVNASRTLCWYKNASSYMLSAGVHPSMRGVYGG